MFSMLKSGVGVEDSNTIVSLFNPKLSLFESLLIAVSGESDQFRAPSGTNAGKKCALRQIQSGQV